jgi:UDP-2,3-diacylglucosamine hydrolase
VGDLVLAADSHLGDDERETERFVRFLRQVGPTAATVILAGDIFDLWIARPGLERPFHAAVVDAARDLRRAGVRVKYVQGNRDYFVADHYRAGPFDAVAEESLIELHAGRRIHVAHGDLVNLDDRQYQRWRRASRSAPARAVFGLIPAGPAGRLSAYLERRFRTTNRRYRVGFPLAQAEAYARRAFAAGAQALVLGHFHEARVLEIPPAGAGGGTLYVLPGFREDRSYLRFDAAGEARFEPFTG